MPKAKIRMMNSTPVADVLDTLLITRDRIKDILVITFSEDKDERGNNLMDVLTSGKTTPEILYFLEHLKHDLLARQPIACSMCYEDNYGDDNAS